MMEMMIPATAPGLSPASEAAHTKDTMLHAEMKLPELKSDTASDTYQNRVLNQISVREVNAENLVHFVKQRIKGSFC